MAIEAITYDRAQSYKEDIPPEEYKAWQPKKVMDFLLSIDPMADKSSTLSVGLEDKSGVPPEEFETLGTDVVLSLKEIKDNYNALGSFLHIPTIKQIEEGKRQDLSKLQKRCEDIVSLLEKVLSSTIFHLKLSDFSTIECLRCNSKIRRRISWKAAFPIKSQCFKCSAEYLIEEDSDKKVKWIPQRKPYDCMTENCDAKIVIWDDEIKPGRYWKCNKCNKIFYIGLSLFKDKK